MNKWFYALMCCLCFSCQMKKESYTITGTVAGNAYENEVVYLVPLEGATVENVDSTYIKEGRFFFTGNSDTCAIHIIRTRPILRLKLQELLVVLEPGMTEVKLDSVSWAGGTALNDALQEWKEKKNCADRKKYDLSSLLNQTKDTASIEREIWRIESDFAEYNYSFVKANKSNVIGDFVFRMTRTLLTPEQLIELEEL